MSRQSPKNEVMRLEWRGSRTPRDKDIKRVSFGDKRDRANSNRSVFDLARSCGIECRNKQISLLWFYGGLARRLVLRSLSGGGSPP